MLFNSVLFLVFFIFVYSLFHFINPHLRKYLLLFSSMVFYGSWDVLTFNSLVPRFLLHFILILTINYFFINQIQNTENLIKKKFFLTFSICINVLNLGFFKYFYFLIDIFGTILGHPEWKLQAIERFQIILPIAISFYTFQTIAFLVDKYKGLIPEKTSYIDFLLFILFFPQQLAGPILKSTEFLPRLKNPIPVTQRDVILGLTYIGFGIIKKGVLADSMALVVNPVFANPSEHSGPACYLAALGFIIQLWGDFSGYSDIAIGLAKLLGFDLPKNFEAPFFSTSFAEMWERWHITLSRFLREYVYFPLGGSKGTPLQTIRNVFLTMGLAGIWHGANWNFLLWGIVIAISLIFERILLNKFSFWRENKSIVDFSIKSILVFQFWILLALIFRVQNLADIGIFLNNIFTLKGGLSIDVFSIINTVFFAFLLHLIEYKSNLLEKIFLQPKLIIFSVGIILLFVLSDLSNRQVQFIYFQF